MIQLFRRMVEYSVVRNLAEFQEIVVLRTATLKDYSNEQSKVKFEEALKKDVLPELTSSYCGKPELINPTVLSLLTSEEADYCCDGVVTVGVPVGTEAYRKSELLATARTDAHEIQVLSSLLSTDPHAATAYVWRSFMHRWESRVKSQPTGIMARPAALVDEALARFFSCQTDFDRDRYPNGLPMSRIQKLLLTTPVSSGGLGVLQLDDRCTAGVYAIGVIAMLTFIKKTGCVYLINTVNKAVCQQALQNQSRDGQLVPFAYRDTRGRRAAEYPGDTVLPENPKKLLQLETAQGKTALPKEGQQRRRRVAPVSWSKQVHSRIMAPVHKKNVERLDALGASKRAQMTAWDRTLLNNREAFLQCTDNGGFGAWWSIVPTIMSLRITPAAFRQGMSVILGRQVASPQHGLHGLVCPCRSKILIDDVGGGTHALSCPNSNPSRAHHRFRDHVAAMVDDANLPLSTVTIEPKGSAVGRTPGDRKGTDLLVIISAASGAQAMEVKSINSSAQKNQTRFQRDQQQLRNIQTDKTHVDSGTRTNQPTAGRTTTQGRERAADSQHPMKTVQKIIDAVNANEDTLLATGRGVKLTCVPILPNGAVHGNFTTFLQTIVPAPDDPGRDRLDQQHAFSWPCPDFRTYALQSSSVAILNAASAGARHTATLACRTYNLPEPDRTVYRWQQRAKPPTDVDVDDMLAVFDAAVEARVSKGELAATVEVSQHAPDEAMDVHQHAFVASDTVETKHKRTVGFNSFL